MYIPSRSPKDKFIVLDDNSKDKVWWTTEEYPNDNKPVTEAAWKEIKQIAVNELSDKKLYVVDCFCGANHDTRMAVRFIVEVAWQAHFVTNMFIQPSAEELANFKPDFVVFNASKAKVTNFKELGLNSETAVVFNTTSREQVIINTWYGGEMKKGMFSMMNYYLPQQSIASMHCSANTRQAGVRTQPSSSASREPARPLSRPTRSVCSSATTSTAGTTTACSTSRAAATPR